MNNHRRNTLHSFSSFLMLMVGNKAVSQQLAAVRQPVNVAGNWTIYSKRDDGKTATKYIHVKQDGAAITGLFRGPYQSGSLVGTIESRRVVFRTRTREALTFRGMVNGDTIQGTFGIRGMHGVWQATRTN